jgi:hypothetical protein
VTFVENLPHGLTLHFVTDANASIAEYALRHIDLNVRMRCVEQWRAERSVEVTLVQAVLEGIAVEGLISSFSQPIAGMILSEHSQKHSSLILERGGVG